MNVSISMLVSSLTREKTSRAVAFETRLAN